MENTFLGRKVSPVIDIILSGSYRVNEIIQAEVLGIFENPDYMVIKIEKGHIYNFITKKKLRSEGTYTVKTVDFQVCKELIKEGLWKIHF